MAADPEPPPVAHRLLGAEARPAAHARGQAVGADQPAPRQDTVVGGHAASGEAADQGLPAQIDPHLLGAARQGSVQDGPAQAEARPARELGLGHQLGVAVADAAKRPPGALREPHPQRPQPLDTGRHQPLSARFVDGRTRAVQHRGGETRAPGRDGRGETGWAAADDQQVGLGGARRRR